MTVKYGLLLVTVQLFGAPKNILVLLQFKIEL